MSERSPSPLRLDNDTSQPSAAAEAEATKRKKRSYSSQKEDGNKENTTVQIMELIQDKLLSNTPNAVDGLVEFSPRTAGHAVSLQRFYEPLSQLKNEYDNTSSHEKHEKSRAKRALKEKIQERIQALLVEAGFPTNSGIVKCILEMEKKNETITGNGAPDDENEYMTPTTKKIYTTLLACEDGDRNFSCEQRIFSDHKKKFLAAYRKDLANAFYQAIMTMSAINLNTRSASVQVESAYTVLAYLDDEANKAEVVTTNGRQRKYQNKGRGGTNLVTKLWGGLVAPILAQMSALITPRVETKEIEDLTHLVREVTGKGKLTEGEMKDYVAKAKSIIGGGVNSVMGNNNIVTTASAKNNDRVDNRSDAMSDEKKEVWSIDGTRNSSSVGGLSVAAAASIVPNKSGSATTIAFATKKHTEKASSAKCQGYNVQCELCQAYFESADQLIAHMGPCYDSIEAAIDGSAKCQGHNVQCELCQAFFESTNQLRAHMGPCYDSIEAAIDG